MAARDRSALNHYLDTSLLVASVSSEATNQRVQAWMRDIERGFVISDWSLAEFASAVMIKQRVGTMSVDQCREAKRWFELFADDVATLLPVSRSAFRRSAELAGTAKLKVRAADALHLAIAEAAGATLCTLDHDQAAAGEAASIRTLLV